MDFDIMSKAKQQKRIAVLFLFTGPMGALCPEPRDDGWSSAWYLVQL